MNDGQIRKGDVTLNNNVELEPTSYHIQTTATGGYNDAVAAIGGPPVAVECLVPEGVELGSRAADAAELSSLQSGGTSVALNAFTGPNANWIFGTGSDDPQPALDAVWNPNFPSGTAATSTIEIGRPNVSRGPLSFALVDGSTGMALPPVSSTHGVNATINGNVFDLNASVIVNEDFVWDTSSVADLSSLRLVVYDMGGSILSGITSVIPK